MKIKMELKAKEMCNRGADDLVTFSLVLGYSTSRLLRCPWGGEKALSLDG